MRACPEIGGPEVCAAGRGCGAWDGGAFSSSACRRIWRPVLWGPWSLSTEPLQESLESYMLPAQKWGATNSITRHTNPAGSEFCFRLRADEKGARLWQGTRPVSHIGL